MNHRIVQNRNAKDLSMGVVPCMCLFAFLGLATASEYELSRQTIDGGGAMRRTGGDFELSGTIGQPDAGAIEGDGFTLTGGFWFGEPPDDCNSDGWVSLIDYDDFCGVVSSEASDAAAGSTLTAVELKHKIDAGEKLAIIDVREPVEWDIVRIDGATLIPKGDILSGEGLAKVPQDRPTVLYCKTGIRSAEALAALKRAGFADATHLQGGVTAWANQVDKTLPVY